MANRPKIRHLAIVTLDPERLAKFYEDVFKLTRMTGRGVPGSKAVYMTDGYLMLAILENKGLGMPTGINHFGFHVDDADEIARSIVEAGLKAPSQRPADGRYAETRATDPDGNNFDIAAAGFGGSDAR